MTTFEEKHPSLKGKRLACEEAPFVSHQVDDEGKLLDLNDVDATQIDKETVRAAIEKCTIRCDCGESPSHLRDADLLRELGL